MCIYVYTQLNKPVFIGLNRLPPPPRARMLFSAVLTGVHSAFIGAPVMGSLLPHKAVNSVFEQLWLLEILLLN